MLAAPITLHTLSLIRPEKNCELEIGFILVTSRFMTTPFKFDRRSFETSADGWLEGGHAPDVELSCIVREDEPTQATCWECHKAILKLSTICKTDPSK